MVFNFALRYRTGLWLGLLLAHNNSFLLLRLSVPFHRIYVWFEWIAHLKALLSYSLRVCSVQKRYAAGHQYCIPFHRAISPIVPPFRHGLCRKNTGGQPTCPDNLMMLTDLALRARLFCRHSSKDMRQSGKESIRATPVHLQRKPKETQFQHAASILVSALYKRKDSSPNRLFGPYLSKSALEVT